MLSLFVLEIHKITINYMFVCKERWNEKNVEVWKNHKNEVEKNEYHS